MLKKTPLKNFKKGQKHALLKKKKIKNIQKLTFFLQKMNKVLHKMFTWFKR